MKNQNSKKHSKENYLKNGSKTQNQHANNHYNFSTEEPGINESGVEAKKRGFQCQAQWIIYNYRKTPCRVLKGGSWFCFYTNPTTFSLSIKLLCQNFNITFLIIQKESR